MNLAPYTPLLTQALAYILPFLGLVVPGLLKKDSLSPVTNASIVAVVTLIVSALQAYCSGSLGLNPLADFLAVEAALVALLNGPLKNFDAILTSSFGLGANQVTGTSVTAKRPAVTNLGTNATVPVQQKEISG